MGSRQEERAARRAARKQTDKPWYNRVLDNLKQRLHTQTSAIRIHGFLYLSVSALLIALNLFSTPFPWAFIPIAAWGIGMGGHVQAFLNRRREVSQLSQTPDLAEAPGRVLRQYQKSLGTWRQHLSAFLLTNILIWGINISTMIFGRYFVPWALFVTGPWGIGFICHWMANTARRRQLAEKLKGLGLDLRTMRSIAPSPLFRNADGETGLAGQARAIADHLIRQYRENERLRDRLGDLEPLLNTTVDQIAELEKKRDEFDRITHSFSTTDLEDELAKVKIKRERTTDALLGREYDKSIAQYEQHLKAAGELTHHRELLDLRLNGAFRLVKQLEIDTVRLLSMDGLAEPGSLAALRARTDENQAFLEDFRKSLMELEQDL
jgi:hypothetical protein